MTKIKTVPITYINREGESISIKMGTTTTDEHPKSVFIRTKMRMMPTMKKTSYTKDVLYMKEKFEKSALGILERMNEYDKKTYLFSISVSENGIKFGKKSHFHYDLFLKSLTESTMSEHKVKLEDIANKLNESLLGVLKERDFLLA